MNPPDPHTAGDSEAAAHVSGAIARTLRTQPVLAAILALELPVAAALALAVLNGEALTARGILLMIAAPLIPAVLAGVRQTVTTIAKPQIQVDGELVPLVPATPDEPELE